jgi:competence protein ComEC
MFRRWSAHRVNRAQLGEKEPETSADPPNQDEINRTTVFRRPMVTAAAGFSLGVLAAPSSSIWAHAAWFGLLCFAVLLLLRTGRILTVFLMPVWFFFAGFLYVSLITQKDSAPSVPWTAETVLFEGIVAESAENSVMEERLIMDLVGSSTSYRAKMTPRSGRVSVMIGLDEGAANAARQCGSIGDRVRVWSTLRSPREILMPTNGGPKRGAGKRGVNLYASVPNPNYCAVISRGQAKGVWTWLQRSRQSMNLALRQHTSPQARGLLQALATGERNGLSRNDRRVFQRSGLAHLLAVSGLHMSVAIGLFYGILVFFLSFSTRILNTIGSARLAAMISLVALVLYTGIVGATPSALRAALMLGILLGSRLLKRSFDPWSALGFALIVMLIWDPSGLGDRSLQLSFAAVAALFRVYPALRRGLVKCLNIQQARMIWLRPVDVFLAGLAATIGTLPLVARHFHWISIGGIASNVIATPLASVVVVPTALFGSMIACVSSTLAAPVLFIAEHAGLLLLELARLTANTPGSGFYVPQPSVIECLLFYGCMIGFSLPQLRPRGRKIVWLFLLVFVALVTSKQMAKYLRTKTIVSFVAVGQGDAILIELPKGQSVLIDTGPSLKDSSAAERIISPFLRLKRITHLDAIFITHSDNDHAGGLRSLLEQFPVDKIYWNGNQNADPEFLKLLKEKTGTEAVFAGKRIGFTNSHFEVLHPPRPDEGFEGKRNDRSLVLRLHHDTLKFLFTGDIEKQAEDRLLRDQAERLQADVIKIAHHGSRSSTSEAFLKAVRPKHTVISVGLRNQFGMPHASVIDRLTKESAEIWRTDNQGLITFESNGEILTAGSYR